MILRTQAAAYADCINIVSKVDLLRHLGHVSVPALYIVGAQDLAATPDEMRGMHEATPASLFQIIPDAAHMLAMEQEEAFNRRLLAFFAA